MTMESGIIQAFYGTGKGKTSAAVGQALRELQHGQRITMIQFLKGKVADEFQVLDRLEPDVQIFRFDKSDVIILDELLGLIDLGILTEDDVEDLLRIQGDYRKLIITGTKLPEQIRAYVDEVSEIL